MSAVRARMGAGQVLRRSRRRTWTAERSATTGALLAAPLIGFIAVLLLYPLFRLVSISTGEPDGLGNVSGFFEGSANLRVLRITLVDSLIVTVLSVAVGAVIAWSMRTTRSTAFRLLLWAAMILPFLMGSVNKLYALGVILQTEGIVNTVLMEVGITDHPVEMLYTQFAVVLGMVYQMLPFAVLPLYASFRTISPELVLAAESLGASRLRALANTVVPLALPSVLASATIVFMISVGFVLTPVLLGGATAPFMASFINSALFDFYNLARAAVTSLVLLICALVVVVVAFVFLGRDRLSKAVAS
ncbi:MAG TPA: ABC transporter permease [Solirubrobacteraceae bacterium]|nr:ABC transporter permease [Solirubrobacteraceae bacterium]